MKTKIVIKVPKGQARKVEGKLRPFILTGSRRSRHETFVNKDDSQIIWIVEAPLKDTMKINKNVAQFDIMMSMVFKNKMLGKAITKYLSEEEQQELEDMFINHTKVKIIKGASAEELAEVNNPNGLWQKIKGAVGI